MLCNAMQCNAMQCNVMQCNAMLLQLSSWLLCLKTLLRASGGILAWAVLKPAAYAPDVRGCPKATAAQHAAGNPVLQNPQRGAARQVLQHKMSGSGCVQPKNRSTLGKRRTLRCSLVATCCRWSRMRSCSCLMLALALICFSCTPPTQSALLM